MMRVNTQCSARVIECQFTKERNISFQKTSLGDINPTANVKDVSSKDIFGSVRGSETSLGHRGVQKYLFGTVRGSETCVRLHKRRSWKVLKGPKKGQTGQA